MRVIQEKDFQFSCLETVQLLGNCKASGSTYSAHGTREIQMLYTLIGYSLKSLKEKKRLIIANIFGNLNGPQCTRAFIRKQLLEIYGWFGIRVLYSGRYIEAVRHISR